MSSEKTPTKGDILCVEQGTYAFFNEDTPDNLVAMFTTGMGPCCHFIVQNKANNRMILCHADSITNLIDESHGVSSWIKKVCPDNDFDNLQVHIGEPKGGNRSLGEGDRQHFYRAARIGIFHATGIPPKDQESKGVLIAQQGSNTDKEQGKKNLTYGVVVFRNEDQEKNIHTISADMLNAIEDFEEKGYKILSDSCHEVASAIMKDMYSNQSPHPPLCMYRGRRFTSPGYIKHIVPDIAIKFQETLNEIEYQDESLAESHLNSDLASTATPQLQSSIPGVAASSSSTSPRVDIASRIDRFTSLAPSVAQNTVTPQVGGASTSRDVQDKGR